MTREIPCVETLRVDVEGDVAALELVERLRWAGPRVHPLDGDAWRIVIPCEAEHERVLDAIREWLRTQELASAIVYLQGTPRLVEAAA